MKDKALLSIKQANHNANKNLARNCSKFLQYLHTSIAKKIYSSPSPNFL